MIDTKPTQVNLRVWWIPQVPGKAFYVPVKSVIEAQFVLVTLARYDRFQLHNGIKPDYCNVGGLSVFVDGDWEDWYDEETGHDIDGFEVTA